MTKTRTFLGFILSLVLFASVAFAIPGIPHQFYGEVTVNGNPAADGTTVTAKIDGSEVASTTTSGGKYGYDPIFYVDDPNNNRAGKTINFFVNGQDTGTTATFVNGATTQMDLSITTSSGGGSSSGGGGGGGSSGGGGGGGSSGSSKTTTTTTQPEEVTPGPGSPPEEPKSNIIPDTGTTATTLPSPGLIGLFSLGDPMALGGIALVIIGVIILLYLWKKKK